MIFRTAAIALAISALAVVIIAALAGSADFAAARDGCGAGWYLNSGGCVPTAEEQRSWRLDRERRGDRADERRSDRQSERLVDRPRDFDSTPTVSTRDMNWRSDPCGDGFRRVDGECVRRERD